MSAITRILTLAASCIFLIGAASADVLDTIKQRGKIIIAAKTDYPPWGSQEPDGTFKGMEIELAKDIARRLGVQLELVPAFSSNRVQLLNEGQADLVLATYSVTEERKKQVYFIEPSYYAAMIGVLTRTNSGVGGEASLKGRKICAVAGNYSNKTVQAFVEAPLIEYKTLTEAQDKLRAGECDGVNFDDVVLLYQLKSEEEKWKDYDIALLLTVDPAPWGLAVQLDEKDGRFAKFLSGVVTDWHRRNTLLALERKWVGDNSMALQWLSEKVKVAAAAAATAAATAPAPAAAPSAPETPDMAATAPAAPAAPAVTPAPPEAPKAAAIAPATPPATDATKPATSKAAHVSPRAPAPVAKPKAAEKAPAAPKTVARVSADSTPALPEKKPAAPARRPIEKQDVFNYFGR